MRERDVERLLILLLLWIPVLMFAGCNVGQTVEPCAPLPVVDGHVIVKMKIQKGGEMTLRLPNYVNVERSAAIYGECQYARGLTVYYTWFNGRLLPGQGADERSPNDKDLRVQLGVRGNPARIKDDLWRYTPAIPHKHFPLEYYPRFQWESESGPQYPSSKSGQWGILNTKYKNLNGKPFNTWCSINPGNDAQPISAIEAGLEKYGDSGCKGWVNVDRNGVALSARVFIWADNVPEINHIYDAAYEQLQSFIQE